MTDGTPPRISGATGKEVARAAAEGRRSANLRLLGGLLLVALATGFAWLALGWEYAAGTFAVLFVLGNLLSSALAKGMVGDGEAPADPKEIDKRGWRLQLLLFALSVTTTVVLQAALDWQDSLACEAYDLVEGGTHHDCRPRRIYLSTPLPDMPVIRIDFDRIPMGR